MGSEMRKQTGLTSLNTTRFASEQNNGILKCSSWWPVHCIRCLWVSRRPIHRITGDHRNGTNFSVNNVNLTKCETTDYVRIHQMHSIGYLVRCNAVCLRICNSRLNCNSAKYCLIYLHFWRLYTKIRGHLTFITDGTHAGLSQGFNTTAW